MQTMTTVSVHKSCCWIKTDVCLHDLSLHAVTKGGQCDDSAGNLDPVVPATLLLALVSTAAPVQTHSPPLRWITTQKHVHTKEERNIC